MGKYYIHCTLKGRHNKQQAFTLVEVLIVAAIIGILAAVIIPEYRNYTQKAKESAAKESLQMLRTAIERYAIQHNGVPPGYYNSDTTTLPSRLAFAKQLCLSSNIYGQTEQPGTPGYNLGPYLNKPVRNPFNDKMDMQIIANDGEFPAEATGTNGWIYKAATKTIKLDWPGSDSEGIPYYSY
jgi:prepilin-type N-terminal cleavage/methylation domain-containing protein